MNKKSIQVVEYCDDIHVWQQIKEFGIKVDFVVLRIYHNERYTFIIVTSLEAFIHELEN